MPYRGKPSKNCADCRRRKIKCDLKLPGCTQCSNAGLECEGYRNQLDLMFLDENERTQKSVLKRSKSSRTTASDTETTSSAPSRRSSPTLTTIIDSPSTSRSLPAGSSSREIRLNEMKRRSTSVGPLKTTRAREKKSRTTTPEEAEERTEAKSRAASKAALRRAVSAHQSTASNYLHPLDTLGDTCVQQQARRNTSPVENTRSFDHDLEQSQQFNFDMGLASNMSTPYSQASSLSIGSVSSVGMPSINIPLHYSLNLDVTQPQSINLTNFGPPISQPPMQTSNLPSQMHNSPQFTQNHRPQQQHQQHQNQSMQFPDIMRYEQQWDCGQWIHDVQAPQPRQGGYMQQMHLPTDEEWLQWGEFQPQYQSQPPQQRRQQ